MDDDGAGAQDTDFDKKKGRTLHVETGQEHATQSHLEKAACTEKRETRLTKIARHVEAGKAPKPAAAHFNWTSSPKDQDPNRVLTDFFQELYSIQHDQAVFAQKERTHWMELWRKLRAGLCSETADLDEKAGEKGSPDDNTADVLSKLPRDCLEKPARALSEMCWDMPFPQEWLCSMTAMAPKVVGAKSVATFRPSAGFCVMRKILGHVLLMSLPPSPLESEAIQTAYVPKTRADAVPVAESSGTFT